MVCDKQLTSFHVIENENGHNYLTWTYPTITEKMRAFLLEKCYAASGGDAGFFALRQKTTWTYIQQFSVGDKKMAVVVLTADYEPFKYRLLCEALAKKYSKCGNAVELVKLYVSVFANGLNSLQENGTIYSRNCSNLKSFIRAFGKEVVLIYMAILLKRRVLVYNEDVNALQQHLGAIINLVPNTIRNPNDYLYPLVNTSKELKGLSFYVVGTTNSGLMNEKSLYDIAVNSQLQEIRISPQAEGIMVTTDKLHQEMARFLLQLSESDWDESVSKQQILSRTRDIIDQLRALTSVTTENNIKMITINDLKLKKYSPSVETFLFNLAVAENIMIL